MFLSIQEAGISFISLTLLILGILLYVLFIFFFYHFVAKRDFFELNLQQHSEKTEWEWLQKGLNIVLYILEYIILLPLFILVWFSVFTIMVLFLSYNPEPLKILLIAMAIVTSIRIVTYFNEELATEMAKLIPFVLLATLLIDGATAISLERIQETLLTIPSLLNFILYYLIFAVLIEFILRVYTLIFKKI